MAGNVVTLHICDAGLRLLVTKGKKVKKWAELPLEAGLVKGGVVTDPEKLAPQIRELLETQGVSGKKVLVGISGMHSLFKAMTVPRLEGEMLAQAVTREAEMAFPISLDELCLSWQVISGSGSESETRVFLAAVPRNIVDSVLLTLGQSRLRPCHMTLAPLSLSQTSDNANAILVDVRSRDFDTVVMLQGIPELVRSLDYPEDCTGVQEKLLAAKDEVERSISYYETAHPDNPLDAAMPVVVSGELVDEAAARQFLTGELNRPVLPPSPMFQYPNIFPSGHFLVNNGLAVNARPADKRPAGCQISLNVLPDEYRPSMRPLLRTVAVGAAGAAAVAALVFLGFVVRQQAGDTAYLQGQLDAAQSSLQSQVERQQALKKEAGELEKQIAALQTNEASLKTMSADLDLIAQDFPRGQAQSDGDIKLVVSVLPEEAELSRISRSGRETLVQGTSQGEAPVLDYARELRSSGRFSTVVISSLQETERGLNFSVALTTPE